MTQIDNTITIAYRLENAEGKMPHEGKGKYLTAYLSPAALLENKYVKYVRHPEYGIYEYIVNVPKEHVSADGTVKFLSEQAMYKDRVY